MQDDEDDPTTIQRRLAVMRAALRGLSKGPNQPLDRPWESYSYRAARLYVRQFDYSFDDAVELAKCEAEFLQILCDKHGVEAIAALIFSVTDRLPGKDADQLNVITKHDLRRLADDRVRSGR